MHIRKHFFTSSIFLIILVFLFLFLLSKAYSDYIFKHISDTFIRFHVIANSNSTEDQIIKYKVRDSVINYLSPLLCDAKSKTEALEIIHSHQKEVEKVASNVLKTNEKNNSIHVSVKKVKFPTKEYEKYILPEGKYDSLQIEIGEAKGQNWWCVMFPSICFPSSTDNSQEEKLYSLLDPEELSIISTDNISPDIKFKFKLIELFENIWIFL